MEHYRCYRVYVPETAAERTSDTVEFFPGDEELVFDTSEKLHKLTKKCVSFASPLVLQQQQAQQEMADIFIAPLERPPRESEKMSDPPIETVAQPPREKINNNKLPRVSKLQDGVVLKSRRYPQRLVNPISRFKASHNMTLDPQPLLAPTAINAFPHPANSVIDPHTGKLLDYQDLIKYPTTKATWERSFANELGRLAEGVGTREKGTDTCFFIKYHDIPRGRVATYGRIVVEHRPMKVEKERTRLTVGGDRIQYPDAVSTDTADITTAKLLFNSVVSTPTSKFMGLDIFFLI